MSELKPLPCPFCGTMPSFYDTDSPLENFSCKTEDCMGFNIDYAEYDDFEEKTDIIRRWNTRANAKD